MVNGYQMSPQFSQILDRLLEEYPDQYGSYEDPLRKMAFLKFRDTILETVSEFNRCGQFVRIFPSKNSK